MLCLHKSQYDLKLRHKILYYKYLSIVITFSMILTSLLMNEFLNIIVNNHKEDV